MPYNIIRKNSLSIAVLLHVALLVLFFLIFTPTKEMTKEQTHPLHLCMVTCHENNEVASPKKEQQKPEVKKERVKKTQKKEVKRELPQEEVVIAPLVATQQQEETHEELQEENVEPETIAEVIAEQEMQVLKEPTAQNENENLQENQASAESQNEEFIETNFSIIRDMAMRNLIYPKIARKRGWSGTTTVTLNINIDGKLTNAHISESSGKEVLDSAALEAVLSLKNKNLPKPKSATTISLPIRFSLK